MALDYTFNSTGLAEHSTDELLVTYCTFVSFLLLFTIPHWVQITSLYQWIAFHRHVFTLYCIFYHIFQTIYGLYCLEKECHSTRPQKVSQWNFHQTLPLPDEFLKVHPVLHKITLQQKHSLSTSDDRVHQTLVHSQDHAPADIDPQWDKTDYRSSLSAGHSGPSSWAILGDNNTRELPITDC